MNTMKKTLVLVLALVAVIGLMTVCASAEEVEHVCTLTHYEAVAPTCHGLGNTEHWVCEECGKIYADAEGKIPDTKSTLAATGAVNVTKVEAKEAGCHTTGNVEYYICNDCGGYFTDAACTKDTNAQNVKIGATSLEYVEAVEATCTENGMAEHWICTNCKDAVMIADANGNMINTTKKSLTILPHSNLTYVEAVEPTCHGLGNTAHWVCEDCGNTYADKEGLTPDTKYTLAATGEFTVTKVDAKEAQCHIHGNVEYYICNGCGDLYEDEACTKLTNAQNVKTNPTSLEYVEGYAATCTEDGLVEYWVCTECEIELAADGKGNLINTNVKNQVIPAGCTLEHVEALEPTCHGMGNTEHWVCTVCAKYYADAEGTQITTAQRVTLPATGEFKATKVEAKEATCHVAGNIEHYICDGCGGYYLDEACTQLTNAMSVKTAPTDLKFFETSKATCVNHGLKEHSYCEKCDIYLVNDGKGNLVNVARLDLVVEEADGKSHVLTHNAYVAPTIKTDGMLEHDYCSECDTYFVAVDGNLMNVARLSLIVPAYGENEIPQTGLVIWPAAALSLAGIGMIAAGAVKSKKERDEE